MTEQFANNATTYLDEPCFAGDNVVVVQSALNFPSTPQFRILIDNEYMIVTEIDGNQFSVTRGVEGTDDANHSDLAPVLHVLTAGALYNMSNTPTVPSFFLVPLSNGDPDEPYLVFDSEGQVILVETT